MGIIEFAMQMEKDGEAFYRKSAEATKEPALKEIFLHLAEEEQRHFRLFKKILEGELEGAESELDGGSRALDGTKNIFVKLTAENGGMVFGDDARLVWNEALKIEEKAVKLYSEEATKERDPARKKLLDRIAAEERNHVYLIDNILSFMTDPEGFAESKKFSDFKSWEGH